MKKSIIIVFSFLYLVMVSGISISLHYCGEKIMNISFHDTSKEDDCCGSKKKSNTCCNDKASFVKIKDSHNIGRGINLAFNASDFSVALLPTTAFHVSDEYLTYQELNYYSPPVIYDHPLYLKKRVLII